jgi:hypothetical protein
MDALAVGASYSFLTLLAAPASMADAAVSYKLGRSAGTGCFELTGKASLQSRNSVSASFA